MQVVVDPTFQGEQGLLKVWNATNGAVQVTPEGHLLNGNTSAWVTENPVLLQLAEIGQVVVLSGFQPTVKKSTRKPKVVAEEPSSTVEEDLPVAQDDPAPQEETSFAEEATPPADETEAN